MVVIGTGFQSSFYGSFLFRWFWWGNWMVVPIERWWRNWNSVPMVL